MAEGTTPGAFIPHDTVVAKPRTPVQTGGLKDLLLLLSIVLLVASGALAVAVFLYGQYLQNQSTAKQAELQRAEAAFEPALIEQITRLDDRMRAASQILAGHIAPTAFFQALDQSTLQTVSFQTLDLEAPDPQHITIKMQGIAQSVNSIALQADLFSQGSVITSPIFSNIAREPGGVHFDLSANVNPASLEYSALVESAAAASSQGASQPAQSVQSSAPAQPSAAGSGASGAGAAPSAASPFGSPQSSSTSAAPSAPAGQ